MKNGTNKRYFYIISKGTMNVVLFVSKHPTKVDKINSPRTAVEHELGIFDILSQCTALSIMKMKQKKNQ